MKKLLKRTAASTALFVTCIAASVAAPITYDFTASGFGSGSPVSTVSGSYTLDDNILQDINLSIGSTTYTTSNTGISGNVIGGLTNGVRGIGNISNDFWLIGITPGASFYDFEYTTASTSQFFIASSVSIAEHQEASTPSNVPEPGPIALIGIGLLGLVVNRKRTS